MSNGTCGKEILYKCIAMRYDITRFKFILPFHRILPSRIYGFSSYFINIINLGRLLFVILIDNVKLKFRIMLRHVQLYICNRNFYYERY